MTFCAAVYACFVVDNPLIMIAVLSGNILFVYEELERKGGRESEENKFSCLDKRLWELGRKEKERDPAYLFALYFINLFVNIILHRFLFIYSKGFAIFFESEFVLFRE